MRASKFKIFLIFIGLVLFVNISIAQQKNEFAIGGGVGYRNYQGCFFIDYRFLSQHLGVAMQFSDDRYSGVGVSPQITYYQCPEKMFTPLVNISYIREFGAEAGYSPDNSNNNPNVSVFKTKDANYIVPMLGLRYDDIVPPKTLPKHYPYASLILKLGYKFSSSIYPGVDLVSGPPYPQQQSRIQRYIKSGFVGSLSILYTFKTKGTSHTSPRLQ